MDPLLEPKMGESQVCVRWAHHSVIVNFLLTSCPKPSWSCFWHPNFSGNNFCMPPSMLDRLRCVAAYGDDIWKCTVICWWVNWLKSEEGESILRAVEMRMELEMKVCLIGIKLWIEERLMCDMICDWPASDFEWFILIIIWIRSFNQNCWYLLICLHQTCHCSLIIKDSLCNTYSPKLAYQNTLTSFLLCTWKVAIQCSAQPATEGPFHCCFLVAFFVIVCVLYHMSRLSKNLAMMA